MIVDLLQLTNHSNYILGKAIGTCIGKELASDKGIANAIKSGHYSILEHIYCTFRIQGVSIVLLGQLTRHRHASYSVESKRYVKVDKNTNWYVVPGLYNKEINKEYHKIMRNIIENYEKLISLGMDKEHARYVLPYGTATNIIMSMNLRAFIEQSRQRLCGRASDEIRIMYNKMREQLGKQLPWVKALALPKCYFNKCTETKHCNSLPEYTDYKPIKDTLNNE